MKKKDIRKEWLAKRLSLQNQELQDKTVMMVYHFNHLVLPEAKILLSYAPLMHHNEFDVAVCEQVVKEHRPAVKIAWPKIDIASIEMEAYLIEGQELFAKNKFNILEPIDGILVPPAEIDIVFVPLIGVDTRGYRVGYGKGFYDRYLPRCRTDVVKMGFSLFEPVSQIDDINEFDVPLNYCITPSRIYEF